MLQPIPNLTITVTKTADGKFDYVQIMSGDQFSINLVLIAGEIVVKDARPPVEGKDAE